MSSLAIAALLPLVLLYPLCVFQLALSCSADPVCGSKEYSWEVTWWKASPCPHCLILKGSIFRRVMSLCKQGFIRQHH